MSAFMVSEAHIDAIVLTALYGPLEQNPRITWYPPSFGGMTPNASGRRLDHTTVDLLGEMLTHENVLSLTARYPSHDHSVNPYKFDAWDARRLPALAALKTIQCYEYQACEHDGWDTSAARRFCMALKDSLVSTLPGYDAYPWGIDTLNDPKLKAAA